jgi:hypothetical protein
MRAQRMPCDRITDAMRWWLDDQMMLNGARRNFHRRGA